MSVKPLAPLSLKTVVGGSGIPIKTYLVIVTAPLECPDHLAALILFVIDVFHPVHNLTVELFLNGDVRHRCGWCGSMPMLLPGRKPYHITGPDFFDQATPTLYAPAAGRDDQSLAERMRVPCCPRARLKGYAGALNKRRVGRLKQRVNP